MENNEFLLEKELVKVFSGNNNKDEIEFVARDIRNKIIEGQKFKNFGVAVFDLQAKETEIKEIFSKYEIHYYVDTEMLLTRSAVYKFYVSILFCIHIFLRIRCLNRHQQEYRYRHLALC